MQSLPQQCPRCDAGVRHHALVPFVLRLSGARHHGNQLAEINSIDNLIDALDENDDVQTVWGNYDVPDAIMEKLS